MKNNLLFGSLILAILTTGWAMLYWNAPFQSVSLVICAVSTIIMVIIHERFVFLYAVTASLLFGGFLTVYAFTRQQNSDVQLLYMYEHLLLTGFLLLYWILMNSVKKVSYENSELKQQVQLLQKYNGTTKLLTQREFFDQAQWLMNSSARNQEEVWFVEILLLDRNKRLKLNMQETFEKLALQTIRQKFDLITSNSGTIHLLLKNTEAAGVQKVLERFSERVRAELNLVELPYTIRKERVVDEDHLVSLSG